jgi:hypothetical protein
LSSNELRRFKMYVGEHDAKIRIADDGKFIIAFKDASPKKNYGLLVHGGSDKICTADTVKELVKHISAYFSPKEDGENSLETGYAMGLKRIKERNK